MQCAIFRLRHNVIKTGVRMINLSYSRISLTDVADKLTLDSPEDAEFIVAKVTSDHSPGMTYVLVSLFYKKYLIVYDHVQQHFKAACGSCFRRFATELLRRRSIMRTGTSSRKRRWMFTARENPCLPFTSAFRSVWTSTTAQSRYVVR